LIFADRWDYVRFQFSKSPHDSVVGQIRAIYCTETGADRTGIRRAQIGAIERGEMNVTLRTLKTVADTLKVRIRDLTEDV
jgi:transcriptional regulator with XRE-family HTH domain